LDGISAVACVVKWGVFHGRRVLRREAGALGEQLLGACEAARFGVTPARFDLMRLIYERNFRWVQSHLRGRLGVARATISRMLKSLEKLGWIERVVNPFDRRTRDCVLTYEGRRIVASVMSALIWPRVIARAIDDALHTQDVDAERRAAEWLCRRLVYAFAMRWADGYVGLG
jgi:DNA-binding MarR family transcriptional regulator